MPVAYPPFRRRVFEQFRPRDVEHVVGDLEVRIPLEEPVISEGCLEAVATALTRVSPEPEAAEHLPFVDVAAVVGELTTVLKGNTEDSFIAVRGVDTRGSAIKAVPVPAAWCSAIEPASTTPNVFSGQEFGEGFLPLLAMSKSKKAHGQLLSRCLFIWEDFSIYVRKVPTSSHTPSRH